MEEVKYIPGDLIKIQTTANWFSKGDPVLVVRVCNDKGYIYVNLRKYKPKDVEFNTLYEVCVSDIIPIPIIPEILEKNGWDKEPSENVTWYKYRTDKFNLYICKDSYNNKDWLVCVALGKHYIADVRYLHQLQHFLFGLGLSSDLKV